MYSYFQDIHGLHHLTWPAILETKPNNNTFGIVNVFADRLEVEGYGQVQSRTIDFTHKR